MQGKKGKDNKMKLRKRKEDLECFQVRRKDGRELTTNEKSGTGRK